ncbi:MAG: hypothetical protein JW829_06760, partial [Pirellulales bacterium]|nr:hypothetical protein [Pirellulales bacterium]
QVHGSGQHVGAQVVAQGAQVVAEGALVVAQVVAQPQAGSAQQSATQHFALQRFSKFRIRHLRTLQEQVHGSGQHVGAQVVAQGAQVVAHGALVVAQVVAQPQLGSAAHPQSAPFMRSNKPNA